MQMPRDFREDFSLKKEIGALLAASYGAVRKIQTSPHIRMTDGVYFIRQTGRQSGVLVRDSGKDIFNGDYQGTLGCPIAKESQRFPLSGVSVFNIGLID